MEGNGYFREMKTSWKKKMAVRTAANTRKVNCSGRNIPMNVGWLSLMMRRLLPRNSSRQTKSAMPADVWNRNITRLSGQQTTAISTYSPRAMPKQWTMPANRRLWMPVSYVSKPEQKNSTRVIIIASKTRPMENLSFVAGTSPETTSCC